MITITTAFGLTREPFGTDIPVDNLYPLPGLEPFRQRFHYAVHLGLVTIITGEVGSGKSTSLRAVVADLHPSQYVVISLIATTGSMIELLRQIAIELGSPPPSNSPAKLMHSIRQTVMGLRQKKQTPVLLIDEAHLMRTELFAELHTLTQIPFDTQAILPMVLSGQSTLIDRLLYHTGRPFASRVVGRTHLEALQLDHMHRYLAHHLQIAGGSPQLLGDDAVTAIHQGSGGLLRRANFLARGALLAAIQDHSPTVTAEHVRLAATEIL